MASPTSLAFPIGLENLSPSWSSTPDLRRNLLSRRKSFNALNVVSSRADGELESQVGARQSPRGTLRPFDQPEESGFVVVGKTQVLEFIRIVQPVEVEVHHHDSRQFVDLDQRIAGTLDGPARTQCPQHPAREGRLARTQLAGQLDHAARGFRNRPP